MMMYCHVGVPTTTSLPVKGFFFCNCSAIPKTEICFINFCMHLNFSRNRVRGKQCTHLVQERHTIPSCAHGSEP
jgi:hypothetical protein